MLSTRISGRSDEWLTFIQTRLFRAACLLCGGRLQGQQGLCPACLPYTPAPRDRCPRCAVSLSVNSVTLCGECLARPPAFSHSLTACSYSPPWSLLVHRFKDQGDLASGRFLSRTLAQEIRSSSLRLPDLMIPVPLHASRMRKRGYNQSLEICRQLGKALDLPFFPGLIRCSRVVSSQKFLGKTARRQNLRKAYAATVGAEGIVAGKTVAIVDDVVTTGSTMSVLAGLLLRLGAADIHAWSLTRTDPR